MRWLLVAVVVSVAAASGACGGGGGQSAVEASRVARYRDAAAGLCRAAALARTDVPGARAAFYDRSHDALHAIEADLTPIDRLAAARLFEATARVEAAVDAKPPMAGAPQLLAELERVARTSLAQLSLEVPPCP